MSGKPRPRHADASSVVRSWRRLLSPLVTAAAIASVAAALSTFVLVPLGGHFGGPFEDYLVYSGAAHAVATGISPYASFDATSIVMSGFDYPPLAALLVRPLDVLSLHWQELTWLWLSLAALVGGAVITARALLPRSWPRARIAVVAALTFAPATYNLWHGQINTFIFLLLALALSDYLGGHRIRCGVILGVAASIKLAPIVLLLVLARRGWWRGVAAGVATMAGAAAVAVAALGWPVTHQFLADVLPVLNRDDGWIYNQSWNGVVSRLFEHSVLAPGAASTGVHLAAVALSLATVGLLLVSVRRGARTRAERGAEFACGVLAMLLVGAVTWYPVYVHLLIALAAAAGLSHERGWRRGPLAGWTAVAALGTGIIGSLAIGALSLDGIVSLSRGPLWWLFLQASSLPALLAAALLIAVSGALRSRAVSPAAAPGPSPSPRHDGHHARRSPGACPTASSREPAQTPA